MRTTGGVSTDGGNLVGASMWVELESANLLRLIRGGAGRWRKAWAKGWSALRKRVSKSGKWSEKKTIGLFSFLRRAPARSSIRWGYRRPMQVGLAERLAERRLCSRYGWDLDLFTGKIAVRRGGSGAGRLRHPYPLLFQVKPKIQALRIVQWSRFGNSVIQLRNVLHLAEFLDVKIIEFAEPHPFFTAARLGAYEFIYVDRPPDRATIEGSFFIVDAFRMRVDAPAKGMLFTHYIRPLLARQVTKSDPRVHKGDLVLHFRAGDVFQSKSPHPDYGQPPLSYYLKVVEREKPVRVWLVFEDRGNPCVDAVEFALRDGGIEVILQSATLADDLRVLLSARRLVASRGTFASMVAHLSDRLQRVYFFERGYISETADVEVLRWPGVEVVDVDVLRWLGVEVVHVEDTVGEFKDRLLAHWIGSNEQRELMLSYPGDKLTFDDGHRG